MNNCLTPLKSMADTDEVISNRRYAIVTGANKGVGFEICRQLVCNGVTVVLTARDEKRGLDALQKLQGYGGFSSDLLYFHQLDVTDSNSVSSLAGLIKNQFGRLDILVNNAGVMGASSKPEVFKALAAGEKDIDFSAAFTMTEESIRDCFATNYYGAKNMVDAFVPLLHLSQSPRIVNVSSQGGQLKNISNGWAKGKLSDVDNLTEEKVDEVLSEYLKDFQSGSRLAKGWPLAYVISKAALNAYTRILAKKFPNWKVNCICPGYVKTDINHNCGIFSVEEGAEWPVKLALMPDDGPSGLFFIQGNTVPF